MRKSFVLLVLAALAFTGCQSGHKDVSEGGPVDESRMPANERQLDLAIETLASSDGGTVHLNAQSNMGQTIEISLCHGQVRLERQFGTLVLKVMSPDHCSDVYVKDAAHPNITKIGHFKGGQGDLEIGLAETYGANSFEVLLTSGSGKTATRIKVYSFKARPVEPKVNFNNSAPDFSLSTNLFGRKWAMLDDCGGTVTLEVGGGSVYLNFSNVKNCSNFDILSDNGAATNYKEQKIGNEGNRSERIALPREIYQGGSNTIKVVVKSGSKKTFDVFNVKFYAF